jgi:hypothetical protein
VRTFASGAFWIAGLLAAVVGAATARATTPDATDRPAYRV